MAALGSLVVSLEANMAKFQGEMSKSAYVTEQAMQKMQRSTDAARDSLIGLAKGAAAGISIAMFTSMIKGAIDAADHLNDLSKKTGIAVSTLGGLGFAASQAGGNIESITAAAGKLNKSLAEAAGGNKEFGVAFAALGINIKNANGDLKKADAVIAEIADKFIGYEDGPEKAAIALRLFGKAGADIIPLLDDGGNAIRENVEYYKKYSGVTQEIAEKADAFNDSLGKLNLLNGAFARTLAADLLPTLQAVADELVSSKEKSTAFAAAASGIATIFETVVVVGANVAYVFKGIGIELGGMAAQVAALATLDFKAFSFIGDAMKADAAAARKELDAFEARILNRKPNAPPVVGPAAGVKPRAPILPGSQDKNNDDPARKILDGQLKAIEAALAKERDTIKFHDDYISELRAQDLVDLKTYEEYRARSLDAGLAAAIRNYDAEIAVLTKYKATTEKEKDKQDAQNKINDLVAKKEKERQDAVQKSALLTLGLTKAQNDLNISMKEWTIQQDLAAGQFQFEIDMLGKSTVEVAKLTAARRIQLQVEEEIRRAQEKSSTPIDRTEFDKRASQAIDKSNALYDQADTKDKDPWFNMQESIRRYGEEANNVGAQIGNGMTNAFKSAEDAFVQFTMTGKLSFADLARSVIADIARIQARKAIAGMIDMAISAFGPSLQVETVDSGAVSSSYTSMPDSLRGGRVSGGPVSAGSMYEVNERGPELLNVAGKQYLMMGSQNGTVIPNGGAGGGGSVMINVSVDASGTSTEGNDQQGKQLGAMIGNAVRGVLLQEKRPGGMLA